MQVGKRWAVHHCANSSAVAVTERETERVTNPRPDGESNRFAFENSDTLAFNVPDGKSHARGRRRVAERARPVSTKQRDVRRALGF